MKYTKGTVSKSLALRSRVLHENELSPGDGKSSGKRLKYDESI